jgi:hypothetical protein
VPYPRQSRDGPPPLSEQRPRKRGTRPLLLRASIQKCRAIALHAKHHTDPWVRRHCHSGKPPQAVFLEEFFLEGMIEVSIVDRANMAICDGLAMEVKAGLDRPVALEIVLAHSVYS